MVIAQPAETDSLRLFDWSGHIDAFWSIVGEAARGENLVDPKLEIAREPERNHADPPSDCTLIAILLC